MQKLTLLLSLLVISATLNRNYDPNAIQVIGQPDTTMTYDQVVSGYLGLDALEKQAFKLQILYMEDNTYILFMNKNTKTLHCHDCRFINDNCIPVLRSSVINPKTKVVKQGCQLCTVCKP